MCMIVDRVQAMKKSGNLCGLWHGACDLQPELDSAFPMSHDLSARTADLHMSEALTMDHRPWTALAVDGRLWTVDALAACGLKLDSLLL